MSEEHASPQAGPGIGRRLEQAREERNLSLRQVEESTKIRTRYLEELERENFDVLPPVYVLGSLKTYADFLGLDGAALSRELRDNLEPDEPEIAGAVDPRERLPEAEDGDEAAPALSIGFDHLFVGMGVLIVSALAIMTLVSAVARYEEPKISQLDEPSLQQAPPEMALAGDVDTKPQARNRRDPESWVTKETDRGEGGTNPGQDDEPEPSKQEDGRNEQDDKPKPAKEDEGNGEDERTEEDEKIGEASPPASLFGDAEFVPMPPSPPSSAAPAASANATASASATSGSVAPTIASPEPTTASPAPSASASAVPGPSPYAATGEAVPGAVPAAGASPGPSSVAPEAGSAVPAPPPTSSAEPFDASAPAPSAGVPNSVPAGGGYRSGAGDGPEPTGVVDPDRLSDRIVAEINGGLREGGLAR